MSRLSLSTLPIETASDDLLFYIVGSEHTVSMGKGVLNNQFSAMLRIMCVSSKTDKYSFYQYFDHHLKMERNTVFFLVNSIDNINNSISEPKEIQLLTAFLKSYKQKWSHSFATGSYNVRNNPKRCTAEFDWQVCVLKVFQKPVSS